jgi:large subunit ribosomal protein L19
MNLLESIENENLRSDIPDFRVGDTVAVHVKIREGDKERVQVFEGIVIRKHRGGRSGSFTVRKISYGVGVERVFPFQAPAIDKIELVSSGDVHQARLYYLRDLKGKAARIREKKAATATAE